MTTANEDDERSMELTALQAIFPELIVDGRSPFTASLDLRIAPSEPVSVIFKDVSDQSPTEAEDRHHPIHQLRYLPSIHIGITLPEGYPTKTPPVLRLSTTPKWIPRETIATLLNQCEKLWEDIGHDQVMYLFIDYLQDCAFEAFGLLNGREYLQLPSDLEIELLDHDKSANQAEFDRQVYDCGICLGKSLSNVSELRFVANRE
jgi:E3 ubiquitin-protein ligase RNF14